MSLQKEIDTARAEIRTDGYPVSIGEWMSIYEKRELDIHPEFQRFFRWTTRQKSRLIESILLGIPIPQIFVAQRADGVWDVVDGLQRLSTIFQFAGILRDEDGNVLDPLVLEPTKYLSALEGVKWDDPADPAKSLTQAQRLIVKRAKIDVSIILRESDERTKYELFQRLNTGGSQLSDQELRNSIIVMLNKDFYRWMKHLSENVDFMECVAISDRATEEQYDMELVLRFLVFRRMNEGDLTRLGDIGEFLTDRAAELASDDSFDFREEENAFVSSFAALNRALGSDAFRKYDNRKGKFVGGFSVSAFEAVALGVGFNARNLPATSVDLARRVEQLWSEPTFALHSGSGVRASQRLPHLIPLGRRLFAR